MPPKRKKAMKNHVAKKKKTTITKKFNLRSNIVKIEDDEDVDNPKLGLRRADTRYDVKDLNMGLSQAAQKMHTIKCTECIKRFRFRKSLKEHKLTEHSKLPGSVQCNRCSVCCPDLPTLKRHIADVHERKVFKCRNCDKKFVRQAHVVRHMAQKGCDGSAGASYPCEICSAEFRRKDNLMAHLRLQHILAKDYMCKQCPYSTRTFSKLIIHNQKFHTETKGHHFECDHCGKVTSSRAAICKHLEIHGGKKFACDVCGYSTFTLEVMRRHVFTHLETKPYKCDSCDMSFIQRLQLQKHQLRHLKHLDCGICGRKFTSKNKLFDHAKQHKQEGKCIRPVVDDCENLLEIAEKQWECEVCGKMFRAESDMRRHVTSHLLERPRRCMYCVAARAYVRGEQLVRHVRKAHPDVFRDHLAHVRNVLGQSTKMKRVKKSELDSILLMLDAETDRILLGYGEGVLYGGMMNIDSNTHSTKPETAENSPLMSAQELEKNLKKLLVQLIDKELLECFGWPNEDVDTVLEKVIKNCGAKPADRNKWTRVQCLRENTKHLFLHVIEDKNIARMLDSHTIDQIVKHILTQVTDVDEAEDEAYDNVHTQDIDVEFQTNEIQNGVEDVVEEIYVDGCKVTEITVENEFGSSEMTENIQENDEENCEQNSDLSTEGEMKIICL